MPGTRQPKDKRIQDIIEAALIEFSRNGYDAVRMEDIAERAGMPGVIVERARSRMGREWLDLGAKLRSLDDELEKARDARRRAEAAEQLQGFRDQTARAAIGSSFSREIYDETTRLLQEFRSGR